MPDTLSFTVPGEPTPKARARTVRGHSYTPERTRLAEETVGWTACGAIGSTGGIKSDPQSRFGLFVTAYCKSKRAIRSDGSNFLKLVEDALNGIVWADDWQVFDTRCLKVPVTENPRTEVTIWRMED
ncbi:hypothetical protein LCGC14_1932580 [marine sediment metagenome]|uniref:Uncharacterized protein n=1 Tax=marine sediment metagenome TaxID=412755 RepID=A0A0F9FN45_9ZZZZ